MNLCNWVNIGEQWLVLFGAKSVYCSTSWQLIVLYWNKWRSGHGQVFLIPIQLWLTHSQLSNIGLLSSWEEVGDKLSYRTIHHSPKTSSVIYHFLSLAMSKIFLDFLKCGRIWYAIERDSLIGRIESLFKGLLLSQLDHRSGRIYIWAQFYVLHNQNKELTKTSAFQSTCLMIQEIFPI